jgi:hypothetical protein
MEKKVITTILGAVIIILTFIAGLRIFSGPEDTWLCINNQWEKHGQPSAAMPTSGCGPQLIGGQKDEHGCLGPAGYSWCPSTSKCQRMWEEYCAEYKEAFRGTTTAITNFTECAAAGNPVMESYPRRCNANGQTFTEEVGSNPNINLISPWPNEVITSPLAIKGEAKGSWYFEAVFPVKLEDESGKILTQTQAQASGEWMTENMVPFTANLIFNPGSTTKGFLVLAKDNPSGLPANDDSIRIPVIFQGSGLNVKVYFNNNKLDPETTCTKVFAVERSTTNTEAIGRAALEQLLSGPTDTEKTAGYKTMINTGVKINSLDIKNGIAKVDFDSTIGKAVGGSCRVSAIRAQITETLKQFPTVKEVIISVDGNVDEALQP